MVLVIIIVFVNLFRLLFTLSTVPASVWEVGCRLNDGAHEIQANQTRIEIKGRYRYVL